jgi:xanthine dehydrogenase accessory factor
MNNIYLQVQEKYAQDPHLVLATVACKKGSGPQEPGSSAIFNSKGLVAGTVGGGVVEGKIQSIAIEAIMTGTSGYFQFNLANDISDKESAICGGQLNIIVDANISDSIHIFGQLKQSLKEKIPGVLITMITVKDENHISLKRFWITDAGRTEVSPEFTDKIKPVVSTLLGKGIKTEYTTLEFKKGDASVLFLLEPVFPPPQLIIAGAGHIGRSLAHLGNLLDFEVTVIDDRPEYANFENIGDADHITVKNIGDAIQELKKDDDTYVVIVTRGHKDDAAALKPCIGKRLAYVGMIGSRSKIAAMRKEFLEKGWADPGQWDRIHAPIGLDIKSQTVNEIALSIAAQLVLVRNNMKNSVVV